MQHHFKSIWASRPCSNRWQVFPEYLGIRKALKANQPDARGSERSFAEVALATPVAVQGVGFCDNVCESAPLSVSPLSRSFVCYSIALEKSPSL